MSFETIKAGQRDWLARLNDNLSNNKWERHSTSSTLINGCTGSLGGTIAYNADVFVAVVSGWITIPNNTVAEIGTNPFDGYLDTKKFPALGMAFLGTPKGQNNFSPLQFGESGNVNVRASTGDEWQDSSYTGWVYMTIIGPRGQMKI